MYSGCLKDNLRLTDTRNVIFANIRFFYLSINYRLKEIFFSIKLFKIMIMAILKIYLFSPDFFQHRETFADGDFPFKPSPHIYNSPASFRWGYGELFSI
jgi:hypothetical protein